MFGECYFNNGDTMLYVVKLLYAWLLPPGLFILLLLIAHMLFVKTRRTWYYFLALASLRKRYELLYLP